MPTASFEKSSKSIKLHNTSLPGVEDAEAVPQRILFQDDLILLASSTEALVSEYTGKRHSPILESGEASESSQKGNSSRYLLSTGFVDFHAPMKWKNLTTHHASNTKFVKLVNCKILMVKKPGPNELHEYDASTRGQVSYFRQDLSPESQCRVVGGRKEVKDKQLPPTTRVKSGAGWHLPRGVSLRREDLVLWSIDSAHR
ncbi:hypothetical protein EV421DRAFT_1904542 [Armillaria borealis]|uniref:Uncharacterized protein n=1 Tax=Armillaria borealis TaxID=47425 RepID=A0AA39JHM6_9AGAR|nr:hypothetical protein EV421DRAFT_1904542 [Armillaria borealis]